MIEGGMGGPWDADARKSEEVFIFGGNHDQELLGQILGRSTSAPPRPSDPNMDIGGPGYDNGVKSVSGRPSVTGITFYDAHSFFLNYHLSEVPV